MNDKKNEAIHTFLELRKKGNDINEQFKTVQGTNIHTNEHGVKWDKELENLLSILLASPYHIFLDEAHVYVRHAEQSYIQVPYLIYGEQQDVFLDFNSMQQINRELKSTFIMPLYKESNEKLFILTNQPDTPIEVVQDDLSYTLLEALKRLDEEVGMENGEKDKEEFRLSEYIEEKLGEKGVSKSELSEKVGIKYKTLISKFKINSITGEELIRISIVLDLDLNELKSAYMREEEKNQTTSKKEIKYIASLVKIGFTSGLVPLWELDIPQKQLYPLSQEERNLISEQIEQGYITGYLKDDYPRSWKLKIEKPEELEQVKGKVVPFSENTEQTIAE